MEVSTPSVVPHEVLELGHALGEACPFEDVSIVCKRGGVGPKLA
jgi:hypothetical protein